MTKPYISGVLMCLLAGLIQAQAPSKVDFRRDVLPIFRSKCYECHGPAVQMNRFRLDRRSDAMKGGTIAVIGPGNAAGSRLYQRLIGSQYGMQMPPTGALPAEQIEIIKNWIDQGAAWPDDLAGTTPPKPADPGALRLMDALRQGDQAGFRKALAGNPSAAKARGAAGITPLMYAVLYGDTAAMRLLLEKGADVNARNDAGASALLWAADNLEKTRLLLEHGADVSAVSEEGRTALLAAAGIHGNSAVIKLLLESGAKTSVKAPWLVADLSPLLAALLAGDEEAVRLLIQHGADAKSAGPLGVAFAMRANCRSCLEMFLKDARPDVVIPAMFFVSPPLGPGLGLRALLDHGGNPNAKDPQGNSLFALAASSGAFPVESLQALLDRGADVNGKTALGETALELARRHGQTPVVQLLLKAGAKAEDAAERAAPAKPAAGIRDAVQRSLPLLQQNDLAFLRKSGCVSCHNNSVAAIALAAARKSRFRVDEAEVREQVRIIGAYLESWRERVLQNVGIPGNADTVAYILLGLDAAGYPADPATDAMARYLKMQQMTDGRWRPLANRPPIESSEIQVTAVSMRALQRYGPRVSRADYDRSIRRAAQWLAECRPEDTEDRAFHVLGLKWSGGAPQTLRKAAAALLAEQRSDGGWAQIPSRESDAYATGEALTALQEAGALSPSDPAAKRAVQYLLNTQAEDGSWHVKRRAVPIQPHFESGFPYGRDQFISAAGTGWAAAALAMAVR